MMPASLVLVLAVGTGCAPAGPPGMVLVRSSGTTSGPGALLVAFPATECSGKDSAVFLDDKGGFVAAVAPGTATYLAFPDDATSLFVVTTRDVAAKPGTTFRRHELPRPPTRVEQGVVMRVAESKLGCDPSLTLAPDVVTFEAATRATKDLKWLDARPAEGARWLDEHRARVTELMSAPPRAAADVPKPAP